MNSIFVTAAILRNNGKILIAQRLPDNHMGGKWEFPGGKIEAGETPESCLKRELQEELGISCEIGSFYHESMYDYGDRVIHLYFYDATILSGIPTPIVHSKIKWVSPSDLLNYEMPEADKPVVEMLMKTIGK